MEGGREGGEEGREKEGKLDNDGSSNSLDRPGSPSSPKAPSSSCSSSSCPSVPLSPPSSSPAAVSLLINFSLLTRAQSCVSPLIAASQSLSLGSASLAELEMQRHFANRNFGSLSPRDRVTVSDAFEEGRLTRARVLGKVAWAAIRFS